MSPSPTYSEPGKTQPGRPDENDPARRSKNRTNPDQPKTDAAVDPANLKPDRPLAR